MFGGKSTVKGMTSGTASSVAFTPLQGLEIVNPMAAEKKVQEVSKGGVIYMAIDHHSPLSCLSPLMLPLVLHSLHLTTPLCLPFPSLPGQPKVFFKWSILQENMTPFSFGPFIYSRQEALSKDQFFPHIIVHVSNHVRFH